MEKWCSEHAITIEDIANIEKDSKLPFNELEGKTILITGGTGQIGSALAKTLLYTIDKKGLNSKIYITSRSEDKFRRVFSKQLEKNCPIHFTNYKLEHEIPEKEHYDYVIHTASITDSLSFIQKPCETILTNILGTKNILDYACKNNSNVVYISSMEVYGKTPTELVQEDTVGTLDHFALRSSYSESKRCSELLCKSYFSEKNVNVKILRPTLTFGTALDDSDNRIYAQLIRSIINKTDIILHTEGKTTRDYLYIYDAVHAIISVLLLGKPGEAYNISNEETYCSILDMAKLAQSIEPSIKIIFDLDKNISKRYSPEIKIKLDNSKINSINDFNKNSLLDIFKKAITLTQSKSTC